MRDVRSSPPRALFNPVDLYATVPRAKAPDVLPTPSATACRVADFERSARRCADRRRLRGRCIDRCRDRRDCPASVYRRGRFRGHRSRGAGVDDDPDCALNDRCSAPFVHGRYDDCARHDSAAFDNERSCDNSACPSPSSVDDCRGFDHGTSTRRAHRLRRLHLYDNDHDDHHRAAFASGCDDRTRRARRGLGATLRRRANRGQHRRDRQ